MTSLAIATSAEFAQLSKQDRPLIELLSERGVDARPVVWDAANIDWRQFDTVLIRTVWDYTEKRHAFDQWLEMLAASGVALINPLNTLRWNIDKRYLLELAEKGVPVVPTRVLEVGCGLPQSLESTETEFGFKADRLVIKPCVSASARGTWVAGWPLRDEDLSHLRAQNANEALLVQPFLNSITSQGEWSVMVFGGRYSHAVRKVPASGDFRVQQEHGGVATLEQPSDQLVDLSLGAIASAPGDISYARVDWVETVNGWQLMELELIEPELFLARDEAAPARFVEAVLKAL